MNEITLEKLPAAMAARIPCPVGACEGIVRLGLLPNTYGDVSGWVCHANPVDHQWHEDGKPRWVLEFPIEIYMKGAQS